MHTPTPIPSPTARRPRGGFTITELMISVALVLILTLAIGLIFRTTSETIGKSQATGQVTRNLDAVRTALQIDFTGTDSIDHDPLTDGEGILPHTQAPFFIISSSYAATWLNQEDFEADADLEATYDPTAPTRNDWVTAALTLDTNGDGDEADSADFVAPLRYGRRTFRTDTFGMFVKGNFESQTGRDGAFLTTFDRPSAYVWYGHLRIFNNDYARLDRSDAHGVPGLPFARINYNTSSSGLIGLPNVNNQFADQFALGRMAILLSPYNATVSPSTSENSIVDDDGNFVNFLYHGWDSPTDATDGALSPLTYATVVRSGEDPEAQGPQESGTDVTLYRSRYDIAATTPTEFRERLAFVTDPLAAGASYYRGPFVPGDQDSRTPTASSFENTWWYNFFASYNIRFWANPFGQQPFDSKGMGQRFHFLAPTARQFVVEYAGDYVTQDRNFGTATFGDVLQVEPDGEIDFVVRPGGQVEPRFYGFPRDVDGDGVIPGAVAALEQSGDVVPLRTFIHATLGATLTADGFAGAGVPASFPHERLYPLADPPSGNYGDAGATPAPFVSSYTCAWGPVDIDAQNTAPFDFPLGPKLIRIVVEASDDDGKLEQPLQTEVVFRIPE